MVVKSISQNPSNFMSEGDFDKFLKDMKVVGVYGVDTRAITKKIRNSGAMKCIISTKKIKPGRDIPRVFKLQNRG